MAGRALEPDVEEVRQLSVHHVVVVRRVHDDHVDRAVVDVIQVVARHAGDGDGGGTRIRAGVSISGVEKTARAGGALRPDQRYELADALGGLSRSTQS